MDDMKNFLKSVAGTGEIISLAYAGGSRPGEAREVIPVACSESTLDAIDPRSNIKKQYKFDKILWAAPLNGNQISNPSALLPLHPALPELPTLPDYWIHLRNELESAGWFVLHDESQLSVATFFKNGKPRKTPSISVRFVDRSTDLVWDLDADDIVEVKRKLTGNERPWRVDSWRFRDGKTYKDLHRAVIVFLEEVRASNPAEAKGI